MSRLKIYYQYSWAKTLRTGKGDRNTEIGILTALSQFADVYYSGTRFIPSAPGYGLRDYPGAPESRVPKDCDVYYVRANAKVFKKFPANKPRLWFASPYDKFAYDHATALATFSDEWSRQLRTRDPSLPLPLHDDRRWPKKVVTIHQVLDPMFVPRQKSSRTRLIRKSIGGNFIIGFFGAVRRTSYPHGLFRLLPALIKKYPGVRLMAAPTGKFPGNLPNTVIHRFRHNEAPYVISACDLIVITRQGACATRSGCLKTLEAAACGVPVLLGLSAARAEVLGEDYPFFQPPLEGRARPDARRTMAMLKMIIQGHTLRKEVASSLPARTRSFSLQASAVRLEKLLRQLVKSHD